MAEGFGFNKTEYAEAVKDSGLKDKCIAAAIGITFDSYRQKKCGTVEWKLSEIQKVCSFLKLSTARCSKIFPYKVNKV